MFVDHATERPAVGTQHRGTKAGPGLLRGLPCRTLIHRSGGDGCFGRRPLASSIGQERPDLFRQWLAPLVLRLEPCAECVADLSANHRAETQLDERQVLDDLDGRPAVRTGPSSPNSVWHLL